jgi:hypothetical protein
MELISTHQKLAASEAKGKKILNHKNHHQNSNRHLSPSLPLPSGTQKNCFVLGRSFQMTSAE